MGSSNNRSVVATIGVMVAIIGALAIRGAEGRRKHEFDVGDRVAVYVNNLGPYYNTIELYKYDKYPWCPLDNPRKKHTNLGESLEGDRPVLADIFNISYRIPSAEQRMCRRTLDRYSVENFRRAIEQYYYYEMICDDLPIHGFIGYMDLGAAAATGTTTTTGGVGVADDVKYYLFTHFDFTFAVNGKRIVQVNVTTDKGRVADLTDMDEVGVDFTYSVRWVETAQSFKSRMSLYNDHFFSRQMEVHWLSIMNSIVLVVLLTGFLAIIVMRIVRNDFIRYEHSELSASAASSKAAEEGNSGSSGSGSGSGVGDGAVAAEDYGWKLVHGDVFRFPSLKMLFCGAVGSGAQMLAVAVGLFGLSFTGTFHPENGGAVYVAAIVLYALAASVGGFYASRLYRQLGGVRWAWPVVITATLFPAPLFVVFVFVNFVAVGYGSTAALRFVAILQVLAIYALVGVPLTVIGGIVGRRTAGSFAAPCRTKNAVREVPPAPWYRTAPAQMLVAGFLPFSAIYVELFYVYASLWGHTYYGLYGILAAVFVILLVVTASITVALVYFQLSKEDHRWWWNSFCYGGATGIFVFAYSVFYFLFRTKMSGFLQGAYYFGYTFVGCFAIFLMLGTVGFYASLFFVRYIYSQLKID